MPTKFYEFYDKPVKMRLENNDILMYSNHNEGEKGWKVKEKYWRVKFIKKKKANDDCMILSCHVCISEWICTL